MKDIKIKNLVLKVVTFFTVAASLSVLNGVNDSNVAFAMEKSFDYGFNSDFKEGNDVSLDNVNFKIIKDCAAQVNASVHKLFESAKLRNLNAEKMQKFNIKDDYANLPIISSIRRLNHSLGLMKKQLKKSGFCEYVDNLSGFIDREDLRYLHLFLKKYIDLRKEVEEVAKIMFKGFDDDSVWAKKFLVDGKDLFTVLSNLNIDDCYCGNVKMCDKKLRKICCVLFDEGLLGSNI